MRAAIIIIIIFFFFLPSFARPTDEVPVKRTGRSDVTAWSGGSRGRGEGGVKGVPKGYVSFGVCVNVSEVGC